MDPDNENPEGKRTPTLIPVNDEDTLTQFEAETAGLFLDFFIGLFNTILYKRAEYKKSTFFFSRKIFNLELAFTFHPQVSRYVEDCSKRAATFVLQNLVSGLQLNLLNASNIVVQRFILKLEGKWTWTKGRYSDEENALTLESVRAGLKRILVRLNDPNVSLSLPYPVESVDRFVITFGFGSKVSLDSYSNIIDAALLDPDVYEFPWSSLKKTQPDADEPKEATVSEGKIKEVGNQKRLSNGARPNKTPNDCKPLVPSLFPVESVILAKSLVFNFYVLTYPKEVDEDNDRTVSSLSVKTQKPPSSGNPNAQDKTQREMRVRDEELLKRLDGPSSQLKSHNNNIQEVHASSGGQLEVSSTNMASMKTNVPIAIGSARSSTDPVPSTNSSTDVVPSSSASASDAPIINRSVKRKSSPDRLLQCLSPLLDATSGAIKSEDVVPTMLSMLECYDQLTSRIMSKFSRKFMNKCIFINVLNSTASMKLMNTFLQKGGWSILHRWTKEGIEKHNNQLLAEVFMLLLKIHVTPSLLRENNLRDLVKLTTSINADETVKSIALRICATWDIILNQGRLAPNSSHTHFTDCNSSGPQRQDAAKKQQNFVRTSGALAESQKAGSSSQEQFPSTPVPSGHESGHFGPPDGLFHRSDGSDHDALEKNVWSSLSLQPDLAEIPAEYLNDCLPSSGNDDQNWNALDEDLLSEVSNAIMGIQSSSSSSSNTAQGSPSKPKSIQDGITHADHEFASASTADCDLFPELSHSNWVNSFMVSTEIETEITETLSKMTETVEKVSKVKYSDPKLNMRPVVYMEHVKIKEVNSPMKISPQEKSGIAAAMGKQPKNMQTPKKPQTRRRRWSWRRSARKASRKMQSGAKQGKSQTADLIKALTKPLESKKCVVGSQHEVITISDDEEEVVECAKSRTEVQDQDVKKEQEQNEDSDQAANTLSPAQTQKADVNIPATSATSSTKEAAIAIPQNPVAETVPPEVGTHTQAEMLQPEKELTPPGSPEEAAPTVLHDEAEAALAESSHAKAEKNPLTVEKKASNDNHELISTKVLTDDILVPVPEHDNASVRDDQVRQDILIGKGDETSTSETPVPEPVRPEDVQTTDKIDEVKEKHADNALPNSKQESEPIFWLKEVRLVRLKPEKILQYLKGKGSKSKFTKKAKAIEEESPEESSSDVSSRKSWRQMKPKALFEAPIESPKSRSPVKLVTQKTSPKLRQFEKEPSNSDSSQLNQATDIVTTLTESQARGAAMCIPSSRESVSSRSSSATSTSTLSQRNSSPNLATEPPRKHQILAIQVGQQKRVSPNGPRPIRGVDTNKKLVAGPGWSPSNPEPTKKSKSANVPQTKHRLPSLSNRKKQQKLSAEDIATKKRDELVKQQVERAKKESLMRAKSKNLAKVPAKEDGKIVKRFKQIEVVSDDVIEASSAGKEKAKEVPKPKEFEPPAPTAAPSENVKPTKPNKNASFIDMISIPGAGAVDSIKIKPVSKTLPVHSENPAICLSTPLSTASKDSPVRQSSTTPPESTEKVKNVPKVYKTKRSRSDCLLDEMKGDTEEATSGTNTIEKEKDSAELEKEKEKVRKEKKHKHKSVILPIGPNNVPLQTEESKIGKAEHLKESSKLKRKSEEETDRPAGEKKIMKFITPFDSIDFTFVRKEDVDAVSKDVKKSSESKTGNANVPSSKVKQKEDRISAIKQKAEQDYKRRMESQPKNFHSTIVSDLVEAAGSPDAGFVSSSSSISNNTAATASKARTSSAALSQKNGPSQSCVFDILLDEQALELYSYRQRKEDKRKKKALERRESREAAEKANSASQSPEEDSMPSMPENEDVNPSSSSSKLDGSKGILVLMRDEKRKRKSVRWKADFELETLHEFELDASERVNVTRIDFSQMKKLEMEKERTMIMMSHPLMSKDQQILWTPPRLIEFFPGKPQPAVVSTEKRAQEEREKLILGTIYFWKKDIPFSPAEPDPEENVVKKPPTVIPTAAKRGSEVDFSDVPFFVVGENSEVATPMVDSTTSKKHRHEFRNEMSDHGRRTDRNSYLNSAHSSTSSSRSPHSESGSQNYQGLGPSMSASGGRRKSRWGNSYEESFVGGVTEQTPTAVASPQFSVPPSPYPFPEQTYPGLPGYLQTDPRQPTTSTPQVMPPDFQHSFLNPPHQLGVPPVLFPPGEIPPSPMPYPTTFLTPQPVPPPPVAVAGPTIPQSVSKDTTGVRPPVLAIVPPPTILNKVAPPPAGYSRQPFRMVIGPRQRPPLKKN